jgi:hypothetical protein
MNTAIRAVPADLNRHVWRSMRLIVLCGLLALAGTRARAQSLVQNINISLTGYSQGASNNTGTNATQKLNTTKVTTATVIQALGAVLDTTFSSKAQLQAISDTSGDLQSIVVSDGGQQTDVTSFFTLTTGNFVSKSTSNDNNGAGNQIQYGIEEFALSNNGGLSFDVQGFTTVISTTTAGSNGTTTITQLTASVAGSGTDANGNATVLRGTISITGKKLSGS